MKKPFFLLACVAMSVLAMGQNNQLVWANGRLVYGTPIESIDSLTYDEMEDVDTLHLLLPRTLIKVVHDTVYIHDTVYVETDCGEDTPSAGIGVFSVGEGKTVTFSKGNLQYTQSTNIWSFAENQWDYIGTDNVTGGSVTSDPYDGNSKYGTALADKVDLFGWSTGATNFGVSTSVDDNDYSGSFVDWGTNKIGTDAPNTWRTLTLDEWHYLRYTRTNANDLVGVAQVNGVNGLILLPDNWTCPSGVTFKSDFHSSSGVEYYAAYQTFTAAEWSKLESAGAVFLPAAGARGGSNVSNVQYYGHYWSAKNNSYYAYCLYFYSVEAFTGFNYPYYGQSVRLVKDIEGGGATPDTPDTPTEPEEPENTENGHEYVDLGLSVKWATCNVGAIKPEEYGEYFAWGEVEPKEEYTLSNYKWSDGTYSGMSKYEMHSLTTLEKEDDVANIHWGSTWHTPTHLNWEELRTDCNWTLLTHNGIDGYKVTGPNGNSIFIPMGDYWSSSLYIEGSSSYLSYGHNSNLNSYGRWIYYRETGNSIRPVCE